MAHDIVFVSVKTLWLFLPAYVANMVPVILARFHLCSALDRPIDARWTYRRRRVLGDHKTWRGLIGGVVVGSMVVVLQSRMYFSIETIRSMSVFDYSRGDYWLLGLLLSFGALFGDAVKSFFKRQLDIKEGQPFVPWDQIDQAIGSSVMVCLMFIPPWPLVCLSLLFTFCGTALINGLAYWLRLKNVPY